MKVCVWGGTIEGGVSLGSRKCECRQPRKQRPLRRPRCGPSAGRAPASGVFGGHEFAFPDARLRPRLGLSVTSVGRPTWGSIPWAPGAPCRGQDQTCPPADGLLTRPARPLARALQGRAVS